LAIDAKTGKLYPGNNKTFLHYFGCDLVIFRPRDKPIPENSMKLVNKTCKYNSHYNPLTGYPDEFIPESSEYEE